MDETCDVTFTGENTKDNFGCGIGVGDVDNDGRDDIIVGARGYQTRQGRAYLYWGKPRANMNNVADLIFDGEGNNYDNFGGDDIAIGLVNDDDYRDIAIMALGWPNGDMRGRTYLYYGDTQRNMNVVCDRTFTGFENGNEPQFATIGDLNKDGYGDLVVGGWGYNNSQGRVWLYYGGPSKRSTDVTFRWDTAKASKGKHILKAETVPIAGEEDAEDNSRTTAVRVK
jgi:hypothetical protein